MKRVYCISDAGFWIVSEDTEEKKNYFRRAIKDEKSQALAGTDDKFGSHFSSPKKNSFPFANHNRIQTKIGHISRVISIRYFASFSFVTTNISHM